MDKSKRINNKRPLDFIHLHNYSYYSFHNSTIECSDLIETVKENNFKSIALTDCFNMHGVPEFLNYSHNNNVKPIIGQVFNISSLQPVKKNDRLYKILLIASTKKGFQNLATLSSLSWELNSKLAYIEIDLLDVYHEGLICLTSGLESELSYYLLKGDSREAAARAGILKEIFPEEMLYLELQDHGYTKERIMNDGLINISKNLGIPVVATNQCRYVNRGQHEVFNYHYRFGYEDYNSRKHQLPNEYFLKTAHEMSRLFNNIPKAIHNTVKIADMVDGDIDILNKKDIEILQA